MLALNLANDICTGGKSVQEAKDYMTRAINDEKSGKIDEYMKGLKFQPQTLLTTAEPGEAR
jgi:hypothetical protein